MRTFDFVLLGLFVGLAIGGGAGFYFHRRLRTRLTILNVIHDNIQALRALRKLRAGRVDETIKLAETALDVSVITLAGLVRPVPKERRDQDLLFHIRQAREYREKFPYKSKTEGFDWQVAQAFALVN